MTPERILEFLNKGGLLAGAIITCTYAFVKIDRLEMKTDTLQAVVIDCYKERLEDIAIRNSGIVPMQHEPKKSFAILPTEIKIINERKS